MNHLSLKSLQDLWTVKSLKAAGIGALGAYVGYFASSLLIGSFFQIRLDDGTGFMMLVLNQALLFGTIGTVITASILAWDNHAGLRGRWDRDLLRGLPLFLGLSLVAGAVGQTLYSLVGITRGLPWMLIGAVTGLAIGLLRRDQVQAAQGAIGGVLGGLTGGLLVDLVLSINYTDQAFAVATQWGMVITGALIAAFMSAIQEALKTSWLLGVSAGPYEGREYPLNTAKVTVGRSEASDVALYRLQVPHHLGAFVSQNGQWSWQGEAVEINGVPQTTALLKPGDTLQFGEMKFRYLTRSVKAPDAALPGTSAVPTFSAPATQPPFSVTPPPPAATTPEEVLRMGSSPVAVPLPATPPPLPDSIALNPTTVLPSPVNSASKPAWTLRAPDDPAHSITLPPPPGQVTIGRAPGNSILLEDEFISSQHARLTIGAMMLTVTDLGSTNGSGINGQPLTPQVSSTLRAGDRLRLGHREYVVEQS